MITAIASTMSPISAAAVTAVALLKASSGTTVCGISFFILSFSCGFELLRSLYKFFLFSSIFVDILFALQ